MYGVVPYHRAISKRWAWNEVDCFDKRSTTDEMHVEFHLRQPWDFLEASIAKFNDKMHRVIAVSLSSHLSIWLPVASLYQLAIVLVSFTVVMWLI